MTVEEKQTLMGLAYDIRQSLKDSQYKELVELIAEKEQRKKKFVKITYRVIGMVDITDIHKKEITELEYGIPKIVIFEVMPLERACLEGWDETKITQEELDKWEDRTFIHPTVNVFKTHQGECTAIKNRMELWAMETTVGGMQWHIDANASV
tara:strand:+ start:573 stop:1028 length:456 start_codon:yes stop_codon:yes gene_type:complete